MFKIKTMNKISPKGLAELPADSYAVGDDVMNEDGIPPLYVALGVYLPLITTNCAVLGVTILNIDEGYNFVESLVCALGAGLGFLLAMVLFSGVRRRLQDAKPPACFEGLPITLVSAAIVSLSFTGFAGIVDNIFGV